MSKEHQKNFDSNTALGVLGTIRMNTIIVILSAAFFFLCYWNRALWATNFALMLLFFSATIAQFREKNYGCFFFYATFFLFLLDTVFFGLFDESLKYDFRTEEIEYHALLCLAIAVIGVYIGAQLFAHIIIKSGMGRQDKRLEEDRLPKTAEQIASPQMRLFLKLAFLFCGSFNLVEAMAKALFVGTHSYVAYYTDYTASLPYFVLWLSSVSPLLFYLFLGTLPKKRETIIPTILYLAVGVVTLFYGQRNVFVVRAIIVLSYFFLRNANLEEVWLSKRGIAFLILLIPAGVVFMGFWGYFREGQEYESISFFQGFLKALLQQGNCISIIDFEYRFRDALPDKPYAIGGIIATLHNNIIARVIGLSQIPVKQHTVETALDGYSFEAALMYVENRRGYLKGYGIGSCYVAELFNSFGYAGILGGSALYGALLRKLGHFQIKGFIVNGITLFIFQALLMAPRATYDGFASGLLQVATLFILLMCWVLSKWIWTVRNNE